jgi:hypothetical protein
MRNRFAAFLGVLLLTSAAQATPILTVNAGASPAALTAGTQTTLSLTLTPLQGEPLAGFNLIFAISSPSSISVVSCTAAAGVQSSCADPTGLNFSFGITFGTDQTSAFGVASVTIDISPSAVAGATITLTSGSTWTDPNFDDFFFSSQVIGEVVQAPEPLTASLLALGLGGLALLGRKRST